jgi:hypothetical protein
LLEVNDTSWGDSVRTTAIAAIQAPITAHGWLVTSTARRLKSPLLAT